MYTKCKHLLLAGCLVSQIFMPYHCQICLSTALHEKRKPTIYYRLKVLCILIFSLCFTIVVGKCWNKNETKEERRRRSEHTSECCSESSEEMWNPIENGNRHRKEIENCRVIFIFENIKNIERTMERTEPQHCLIVFLKSSNLGKKISHRFSILA